MNLWRSVVVPLLLIVAVTIPVLFSTARRMLTLRATPWLFWVVLLIAAPLPVISGYFAFFPGEPLESVQLEGPSGEARFDLPAGSDLLLTAILPDLLEVQIGDEDYRQTDYVLKLNGHDWKETVLDEFKRGDDAPGKNLELDGRADVMGEGSRQTPWIGEDIQTRYRPAGVGKTRAVIHNWSGGAATGIQIDVVRGGIPHGVLIGLIFLLGGLALVCDTRMGTDRLATDVGFFTFAALLIARSATPLGGGRDALFLSGTGLIFGGITFLVAGRIAEKLFLKAPEPSSAAGAS
jgi:hypothetical protein